MTRVRTLLIIMAIGAAFSVGTAARADNVPPPPPPDPPYDTDASCTVAAEQSSTLECLACEVHHTSSSAVYDSCANENLPWGYDLACGSDWTEIWCRDNAANQEYNPDAAADKGCNISLGRNRDFPVQLGLVIGLVVFGFLVRRRFRG